MSDLLRSTMSARLAKLPPVPPYDNEEAEEEEGKDSLGSLSLNPPALDSRERSTKPNPVLSPLSASTHFDQAIQVAVPASDLDFRVYITPPVPPKNPNDGKSSIICAHHGAGYSALSFACLAKAVTEMTDGELGFMAFDARAHGKTYSLSNPPSDPALLDLSLTRLVDDFVNLTTTMYPEPLEAPTFVLVGHSMGGAVFTNATPRLLEKKYSIGGVTVLDVVEGSAMEALPHMHQLLASRPEGFPSVERAIEWHITGSTGSVIHNTLSARLSVPSLFIAPKDGEEGSIAWKWRTPLKSTAPFWESWFAGLSKSFLAARTARLLILAGTDRLDRELMIGQMQGKFQMAVIPDVGHMLHEDNPEKVSQILVDFWKRNERITLPGIKKVGER
ncbi:protein phosphatase methylesterase [Cantharellus anzutake]|uniref:protein phosphatase methylesterase n=1 Tax=Cantharellus anzutake TaxID=1750568 RepID=UPI0019082ACE|nr:protein phosphatase methylesterase [Cantharellus anzutake]KAF8338310.1 protein phosphatase methylesterase [Cantharellus anzutake]